MSGASRISRWAERKSKAEKGELIAEDQPQDEIALENQAEDAVSGDDADHALTDDELLARHDLPDPATINDEDLLGKFLEAGIPDRLRQLALRRLWRLNPLFGVIDEMVEYGEDYTDAATVIEGMQSAYQVGKGYLKTSEDALEKMTGAENPSGEHEDKGQEDTSDPETAAEEEVQDHEEDQPEQDNASSKLDDGGSDEADGSPSPGMPDAADQAAEGEDRPQNASAEPAEAAAYRPRRQVFRKQ